MIVKICGITRSEDLHVCADAGVDWIGINFWPQSKRYVDPVKADKLSAEARQLGLVAVALLVEPEQRQVESLWDSRQFDLLQLYSPSMAVPERVRWIQSFPVDAPPYPVLEKSRADHVLLESKVSGFGGAGQVFDWSILHKIPDAEKALVAGGISPLNIKNLLDGFRPFGIDVASGVESSPGLKDPAKIRTLLDCIRNAH